MVEDIVKQLREGQPSIVGVMIESHLNAGRQDIPPEGPKGLKYGVSITDACVDWATTVPMLQKLNEVSEDVFPRVLLSRILTKVVGCKSEAGAPHQCTTGENRHLAYKFREITFVSHSTLLIEYGDAVILSIAVGQ